MVGNRFRIHNCPIVELWKTQLFDQFACPFLDAIEWMNRKTNINDHDNC